MYPSCSWAIQRGPAVSTNWHLVIIRQNLVHTLWSFFSDKTKLISLKDDKSCGELTLYVCSSGMAS